MSTVRRSWIASATLVVVVCALALALRWRGLEHSLPHLTFRDGFYVYTQVESIRSRDPHPEQNPFWVMYPHLVAELVAALPDPEREPLPDGAGLTANLERAAEPWMQIRVVSVLLSLLAVGATFGIARSFLSRGWSAFAAALVAASLLNIFFAQQEKCHGPAVGTTTLAVLAALYVRRKPSWRSFVLGGAAAGLAIATLQSGAAVLSACLCAVVLAWRSKTASPKHLLLGTALALGLVALAVRVFYPFYFTERAIVREDGLASEPEGSIPFSGHHIEIEQLNGGGFVVILDTLVSFEPVALALALVGVLALLARRRTGCAGAVDRGDLWVVLAYVVPYTLAVGIYGLSYERFVMPLVPYVAILAAFGACVLASWLARAAASERARIAVRASFGCLVLAPAVALAWKLGSVRAADDTLQKAAAWISKNAQPERDRIDVLPYLDLPLLYTEEALRENVEARGDLYWLGWLAEHDAKQRAGKRFAVYMPENTKESREALADDPLAYFRAQEADYVVVQDVPEQFRIKALQRAAEGLRAFAEPVARFSPLAHDSGESAKLAIRYTKSAFERPFFVHLLSLEREGPTVEIYRLKSADAERGGEDSSALTAEQRAQIEALESIGYAGGTTVASGREGVTVFDEARASPGFNVLVCGHAPRAELVDMRARPLHAWQRSFEEIWPGRKLPESRNDSRAWRRVRVLPGGELLAIFEGLGLVKLDRHSNVLWSFDGLAHHALDVAIDGRIFVLTRKAHVNPRFHSDKPILEDFVTILDAAGRELESVSLLECFDRAKVLSEKAFHAGDIFHTNTLALLDGRLAARLPAFAAGNLLVSLRNTNQLAVVDLRERTVPWVLEGSWKQQHEPVLLDDGNLLLFDNKGHRERSSVLEIDPRDGRVVWSYSPEARAEFYSASCGSVQRLDNGNTLIVSTEQARAFEVTRAGAIVWEYWSPHRLPEDPTLAAMLFDCVRLASEFDTSWIR